MHQLDVAIDELLIAEVDAHRAFVAVRHTVGDRNVVAGFPGERWARKGFQRSAETLHGVT
jgi:hypothetical protein